MEEFNGDEHTEEVEAEVGGETGEEAAEEAAEEKVAEEKEAVEDTEESLENTVIGSQNPMLCPPVMSPLSISLTLSFSRLQGFVSLELLLFSSPPQLWTILTHLYSVILTVP